ncbi:hypothetical protein ACFU0X_20680 [Streptomyces cellulosae]|uniref:Uncharacterized protein n=1 Tax=Streptomyces cellulosae TaxID=1968 RepID=A0ABW6JJ77_STRCE
MTATQRTEPTPHPLLLDLPEQVRRDLIAAAVDSVRWARDWSATQAADADPGIYSPQRRHSYDDPGVCLARGRDAAYVHAAACAASTLAHHLGIDPNTLPDADFPEPLSIFQPAHSPEGDHS